MSSKYKQLRYDCMDAQLGYGVTEHPQRQMAKLGYEVIAGVPQSVGDQWWFTVKEIFYPLPEYLTEMTYNFEYWHAGCHKDCKHFKKDPCCCHGGWKCLEDEE